MSNINSKEINPLTAAEQVGDTEQPLRYASDPSPEQAAQLPTLELSTLNPSDSYEGKCQQALRLAEEAFAKTGSWVIFFREILGKDGAIMALFPDAEELKTFIAGPEYATLHEMLAAIRSQDQSKSDAAEPERMITIRIPRSLHELLQEESKSCGLSINKLSISKLLWPANPRFVPEQQGRRRGRKPGPQGSRGKTHQTQTVESPSEETPRQAGGERIPAHSWAVNPLSSPEQ